MKEQISTLLKQETLYAAMGSPGQPIAISMGAPGEEVWHFMKSKILIKYQQKDEWYCLTHGLTSALHFVGNCDHIIK